MKDYYEILEVDINATSQQIKKAYRRLSKKYHPDVNSGYHQYEEKFKEINEAYIELYNAEKRIIYDHNFKKYNDKEQKQNKSSKKPEIILFSVSRETVEIDEEIEIKWEVKNATIAVINLFGEVNNIGTKVLKFRKPNIQLPIKLTAYFEANKVSVELFIKVKNSENEKVKQEEENKLKQERKKHEEKNISIKKQKKQNYLTPFLICLLFIPFVIYYLINTNSIEKIEKQTIEPYDNSNNIEMIDTIIIEEPYGEDRILVDSRMGYIYMNDTLEKSINSVISINRLANFSKFPTYHEFKVINNIKYMFFQYFSGGAHCCVEIMAFKFNEQNKIYTYLDEFGSIDGDPIDLKSYPFKVHYEELYFHSAYYTSQIFVPDCKTGYGEYYWLKNDKFEFYVKGDITKMIDCFKQMCKIIKIPNLVDDYDNNERETILNELSDIYNVNKDIDSIFMLYLKNVPNFEDKGDTWFEMLKYVLNESEQKIYDQKYRIKHEDIFYENNIEMSNVIIIE